MSTFPTPLNPWHILARETDSRDLEYYTPDDEDRPVWTKMKASAMLFMSTVSAARVRQTEPGSIILTLTTKEDLKEWGRGAD
jgi:hypothetical protein